MSFAATIPDGCRSLVFFFIMCIIWIVFMGFYWARSLCTWLLLSSHFFYEKCDFIAKILIYVGLRIRFYLFSTYNLKICCFFQEIGLKKGFRKTSLALRVFSKTHQSSLTLKVGSTSHLGLLPSGKKRKPLLSIVFTTPSVPLVGDRNVARNHFILWLADHQRSTPAAELRFFVRGWTRLAEELLMGTQGEE